LRRSESDGVRQSYILEYYYDSVTAAGGLPVLLTPLVAAEDVVEAANILDAVILVGGDDINPARYGRELHEKSQLIEQRREEFDFLMAQEALKRGLPLLGICGGCQLVNVALGGSLHQHVPDAYGDSVTHSRTDEMRRTGKESMHEVRIEKGTLLHDILGAETLQANSSHHQSVDRVAGGLRVSARAADGVVEAVEWIDRRRPFMLAVQWHPERLPGVKEHKRLFEALIYAAPK